MRKSLGFLLASVFFFSVTGWASATTYTFNPSPRADLWDLDHEKYYTWGINWSITDGEIIESASLFFDNIRNHDSGPNDLWVHLLDSATVGVTVGTDHQGGGDYFSGQGTLLNHWENLPATAQDITYNFTADQLADLNAFFANGNAGFGFDPDCHFYNSGITFTIETAQVPIPAALWLLGSGLLGLIGIRRTKKR